MGKNGIPSGRPAERGNAMKKIEAVYRLTMEEFRKASYYGLFLRHRRALQIMFLVLGALAEDPA